jgi:asparagine synthase (glutamine-hydrolysing)
MCGIAAVYGYCNSSEARKRTLVNMVSSLEHRGPDGWGIYISPDIALGQARLSIVDVKSGHQPMTSGDLVIIFNGEIFNYVELKDELGKRNINFSTTSDTEVLLKAYETYGKDCFEKLNGQFSVVIWNKRTKELVVARDRFGIRPLYILSFNNQIYIASELKAFDQIEGYRREFNVQHLFEHGLLWNTFGDKTIYQNIRSLPGGHFASYQNGNLIEEKCYYELGKTSANTFRSYNEAEEAFKAIMDDAVQIQLRSDVPVGAYLSGGIDSSVILHLINKHATNKFKTFSITFADKEYDESEYQLDMARSINSEHHAIEISYKSIDENFPETIYHTERPIFRTAPVPLFLLSKLVRENDVKVVLTGEGADEILWGYDSYKEIKLLNFWSNYPDSKIRPQLIKKLYPHLQHYKDEKQFGMMKMFYEGFLGTINNDLASLNIRIHNNQILQNYFSKEHKISFDKDILINNMRPCFPKSFDRFNILQKNQFLEMKTLLSGYLLSSQGDRMSLAHSVEGRYPFLDHRVVDMLFSFNENFKLKGFNQKYILKKSFQNNIPDSIVNRPKRPYMAPDLKSFFKNGTLTDNASFFLSEDLLKKYGIFNPKWVQRFVSKFKDGIDGNIGYRDNMIITYILSTQIANYWMQNPRKKNLSERKLTVAINDYN